MMPEADEVLNKADSNQDLTSIWTEQDEDFGQ